jgi:FkbM family methyltransferase
LKIFIARLARRLGYEVIPAWRVEGYAFAQHLARLFDHLAIDCVFDVGANKGQYRDFLRLAVGFNGPIISFEPVHATFESLSARAKSDPSWIVKNYALGDRDGKTEINVMASSSLTSFLEPDQSHLKLEKNVILDKETVSIRRLDSLENELDSVLGKNCYLKLDTQGYDLQVCNGAGKFLERVMALQSEMSVIPIYQGMPSYIESLQYFNSVGFTLSGMFPVRLDSNLQLVEFDCVMVRHKGK